MAGTSYLPKTSKNSLSYRPTLCMIDKGRYHASVEALRRVLTTALVDVITQQLRGLAVKQLCHDAGTPLRGSARGCVSMKRVARKSLSGCIVRRRNISRGTCGHRHQC
jgi:hypothetical protein